MAGRWIYAVGAIVLVAAAAATWWWTRGAARPVVRTVAVREASAGAAAPAVLNASGYVTARRRATVSAKITGKVVEVRVEEGKAVREGDVVARLDDAEYRATYELTRSRLEAARTAVQEIEALLAQAEIDLSRATRLVADGVSSQSELDAARTAVDTQTARLALRRNEVGVAERELALREIELENTVIRAPFDGVVISKDAQPGEMVSPVSAGGGFTRTGLCTLVDMGSLEIEVDVNESYISRVRPGQPVEAVLDAYPDWKIPGKVITTIPAADRQKATVLVRIAFDELDPRILPDMGVKVAFLDTAASAAPAGSETRPRLLVPRAAVKRDGERAIVFVVRDGTVERRAVRLGTEFGDDVEVAAGLTGGERVAVEGLARLADGDRVEDVENTGGR